MKPLEVAGCVILDDYGRLLLLHRNYDEASHWELPGGKVEEWETPEQAAIRELAEELAIEVTLVGSLGSEIVEEDEMAFEFHWFQAVITRGEPHVTEPNTHDDFDYFDLEDMPGLALSTNMLTLYPKIYSGEISLDTSL